MSRRTYAITVTLYIVFAVISVFQALVEKNYQLISILVAMHTFFFFVVADRFSVDDSLSALNRKFDGAAKAISDVTALTTLLNAGSKTTNIQVFSAPIAFEYILSRVKSARLMYNTSFSDGRSKQGGGYYAKWLNSIIDAVTSGECVIHEVMCSGERMSDLKKIYSERNVPLLGSYLGFDLSKLPPSIQKAPFVEFVVFELDDGSSEVIFGWTTSNSDFFGSDCFLSREKAVVEYFLKMFSRFEQLTSPQHLNSAA